MSHSVEHHLEVSADGYDVEIRRFVPRYDEMLEEAAGALAEQHPTGPPTVLDLGAGTGSLSFVLAQRFPTSKLTLLDADAQMLEQARARLRRFDQRVTLHHGSFAAELPAAHAVVASLSLHHLHQSAAKREVYRRIHRALPVGGLFVNADATVPAAKPLLDPLMERWAGHLIAHGDTRAQAFERFVQWAKEDRYLPLDHELTLLREAGFEQLDVRWRAGPVAVLVARRS